MSKFKLFTSLLAFCILIGCLSACDKNDQAPTETTEDTVVDNAEAPVDGAAESTYVKSAEPTDFICIKMDSGAEIVIQLLPDKAPITVENFKKLVANKFYDGLIFHRVIDGFMIQGGDPEGTGMGGAEEKIKGEFESNGVSNDLQHGRGVVSMARSSDPNSASSQFFICQADSFFLDGDYAAFGQVLSGMDEVDRIANLPKDSSDRPENPPVMEEVYFIEEPQQ